MFKTTKIFTKSFIKGHGKYSDKISEAMDHASDAVDAASDAVDEAFKSMGEGSEAKLITDDMVIKVTGRDVVINGDVQLVRVNGVLVFRKDG